MLLGTSPIDPTTEVSESRSDTQLLNEVTNMAQCSDCVGGVCSRCNGTGEEIVDGGIGPNKDCEKCDGTGDCPTCDGTNEV